MEIAPKKKHRGIKLYFIRKRVEPFTGLALLPFFTRHNAVNRVHIPTYAPYTENKKSHIPTAKNPERNNKKRRGASYDSNTICCGVLRQKVGDYSSYIAKQRNPHDSLQSKEWRKKIYSKKTLTENRKNESRIKRNRG